VAIVFVATSLSRLRGAAPLVIRVILGVLSIYHVLIALIVGTGVLTVNQLDVVPRGEGDTIVWIKAAVTYLVPFAVSNGVVVASRSERRDDTTDLSPEVAT
jgi:hypothetical protein